MSRKQYLQLPVVLLAGLILVVVALVAWIIVLVPAMIYPRIVKSLSTQNVATFMMRRTMHGMRGNSNGAKSNGRRDSLSDTGGNVPDKRTTAR